MIFVIGYPAGDFNDFAGWYFRKGFPAFTAQLVVNHKMGSMFSSLRCGSQSDKGVYNNSQFETYIHQLIPQNSYFVADAGYQLFSHIMTPSLPFIDGA